MKPLEPTNNVWSYWDRFESTSALPSDGDLLRQYMWCVFEVKRLTEDDRDRLLALFKTEAPSPGIGLKDPALEEFKSVFELAAISISQTPEFIVLALKGRQDIMGRVAISIRALRAKSTGSSGGKRSLKKLI